MPMMKVATSSIIVVIFTVLLTVVPPYVSSVEVGDLVPSGLTLDFGFPPTKVSIDDRLKNKNVLIVGLPGAFTPT